MQGNPDRGAPNIAAALRTKTAELAAIVGATKGPYVIELAVQDGRYLNMRLHQGPLKTDEQIETALARAVGVLRD